MNNLILDYTDKIIKDCIENFKVRYVIISSDNERTIINLNEFVEIINKKFPEVYELIKIQNKIIYFPTNSLIAFRVEEYMIGNLEDKYIIYR